MSVLFLRSFFPKLRTDNFSAYRKMGSELLSTVPFHSPIMVEYSHLSSEQVEKLTSIFVEYGVPKGVISSPENVEEAFRIFYSDYVTSAPK